MKKSKIILLTTLIFFFCIVVYYVYPEEKLKVGQKADKIVINKANHQLLLFSKEEQIASYKVSLGSKGLGRKTKKGDN